MPATANAVVAVAVAAAMRAARSGAVPMAAGGVVTVTRAGPLPR